MATGTAQAQTHAHAEAESRRAMWLWVKRLLKIEPVEPGKAAHTEAVLGDFEKRARQHKERLRKLQDEARIARLQDKEEAHTRARGGASEHG
jgi:hypothetical protein